MILLAVLKRAAEAALTVNSGGVRGRCASCEKLWHQRDGSCRSGIFFVLVVPNWSGKTRDGMLYVHRQVISISYGTVFSGEVDASDSLLRDSNTRPAGAMTRCASCNKQP